MALFRKKADPISERSRQLSAQIGALESQIRQMNGQIEHAKTHPRVRSTAVPQGGLLLAEPSAVSPSPRPVRDPIFEHLDYQGGKTPTEGESAENRYNDLGVRKYDLLGALRRVQNLFRPSPAGNPKLVSYLAAGSIRGLRPLRYEKRIARNRFIFLSVFFIIILWGILAAIFAQR